MHRILIVDDEQPARDYIAELAMSCIPNSKVTFAENALDALDFLQTEDFDLLFVDVDFGAGKMTGLELMEEINQMGKRIFTVIISAHHKFEYVIKGVQLGATRYIPKPLDDDSPEEQHENTILYIDKPLYKDMIYDAIKLYLNVTKDAINLKTPDGIHRIQIHQLLAIEMVDRRRIKVYTADTEILEVCCSLIQLQKRLPPNFRYIRRDCIVNVDEVKHFNPKSLKVFILCQNMEYSFIASRDNMKDLVALFQSRNIEKDEELLIINNCEL